MNFTLHKRNINNYSAKVIYNNQLPAPINTDTEYGKLIIQNTFNGDLEYPLYAKESIKKAGVFKNIFCIELLYFWWLCRIKVKEPLYHLKDDGSGKSTQMN